MAHIKYATGTGTGNWVTISNGTAIKVATGTGTGSWVNPSKIYVATGTGTGSWSQVWAKSDPVKYTFVANRSRSFRHNDGAWSTAPTAAAVRNGVFSGSSNCPYVGLFGFSTEYGGQTLAEVLAERPYITNATPTAGGSAENYIELRRMTTGDSATGLGSAYGTWYIATYTGETTDGSPDADKVSFTTTASKAITSGSPLNRGDTMNINMNGSGGDRAVMQALVDHADAKPLVLTNDTSVSALKTAIGSGSADTEYAVFYGVSETTPPKLVITLDYVAP
tara:strand:- start:5579 stop:6415 length:837 start_codon:yes stop_codon:yes gene_type:complete